jgi:hypothetical protein
MRQTPKQKNRRRNEIRPMQIHQQRLKKNVFPIGVGTSSQP